MNSYVEILKNEFIAGDDSFLIQIRPWLKWNRNAFLRLVKAMKAYCMDHEDDTMLERWAADGFWYVSWFVENWSTHPNFHKPYSDEYYALAYGLLFDLASWYFEGTCPYVPGPAVFDEKLDKLTKL